MDYCPDVNRNNPIRHVLQKTDIKKRFFCKNFLIGLILEILVCVLAFIFQNWLTSVSVNLYGLSAYDCRRIFISAMWIWFLFLIQFALVPGLSMKIIESQLKKDDE